MAMAPPLGVYRPAVCCLVLYVVVLQMRLDFTVGVFDAEAAEAPQLENADIARGGGKVTIWDVGQLAEKEESQQKNADNLRGVKKWTVQDVARLAKKLSPKPLQKGKSDVLNEPLLIPDFVPKDRPNEFDRDIHLGFHPAKDGLTEDEAAVLKDLYHHEGVKGLSMASTMLFSGGSFLAFHLLGLRSYIPWILTLVPLTSGISWLASHFRTKDVRKQFTGMVRKRIGQVLQKRKDGLEAPNWSLEEASTPEVEKFYTPDKGA